MNVHLVLACSLLIVAASLGIWVLWLGHPLSEGRFGRALVGLFAIPTTCPRCRKPLDEGDHEACLRDQAHGL